MARSFTANGSSSKKSLPRKTSSRVQKQATTNSGQLHRSRSHSSAAVSPVPSSSVPHTNLLRLESEMEKSQLKILLNGFVASKNGNAKEAEAAFKTALNAQIHFKGKLLARNISQGTEGVKLEAWSSTGSQAAVPDDFKYRSRNDYSHLNTKVPKAKFEFWCTCTDGCGLDCECIRASMKNGHSFIANKKFIFLNGPHDFYTLATIACGPRCHCKGECSNAAPHDATAPCLQLFRPSAVLGMGIRTTTPLPIGRIAFEFIGRVSTTCGNDNYAWTMYSGDDEKELMAMLSETLQKKKLPKMEKPIVIDPFKAGNIGRFVSHSEYPNVVPIRLFQNDMRPQSARLFFVCIREIAAGEELFADYGHWYQGISSCLCGSPACGKACSHLLSLGNKKAFDVLLEFQHRHRNQHGTQYMTKPRVEGEDGKLLLQKAQKLCDLKDERAKTDVKDAKKKSEK